MVAYAVLCKFRPRRVSAKATRSAGGVKGVVNKADDILVFGSRETVEEAEKDHDMNLWNLMLRCKEVNLKLNPKKFQFKVKQVT